ncbi:bifunctional 2-polyprenyl-6-hydroxyphenol methylase/3-demethylubiquinol 3-O-methyltransferase UbiG [Paraburkholderia fungorum]|uniref:SAM-dependent methyltransferase n=1 Tax=Paraburkholderia fungorum TaxID=134537 RepID=A0A420FKJ6_9BURK|nr:class I SAM-dependent methyltransferase [Paraburkholderia fungorum]RKF33416.1 SAM-dependent methyltransferase [Paraburkholderia fungorum]
MNDPAGTAGYRSRATELAAQYESITFEAVHRDVIHLFPQRQADILDIGAGSGRDAAALAARGHRVVAVEPTPELRYEGERLHSLPNLEWVDDHLPTLRAMRSRSERFDLILLTAVWMHLDEIERQTAMSALAELVSAGGLIVMSLRHGPVPAGRRMFDVSAHETIALGVQAGLQKHHYSTREDMLGRGDVTWSFIALRRET